MKRKAKISRKTKETKIDVEINIDGKGKYKIKTGIGFLTTRNVFIKSAIHLKYFCKIKKKSTENFVYMYMYIYLYVTICVHFSFYVFFIFYECIFYTSFNEILVYCHILPIKTLLQMWKRPKKLIH